MGTNEPCGHIPALAMLNGNRHSPAEVGDGAKESGVAFRPSPRRVGCGGCARRDLVRGKRSFPRSYYTSRLATLADTSARRNNQPNGTNKAARKRRSR